MLVKFITGANENKVSLIFWENSFLKRANDESSELRINKKMEDVRLLGKVV
jgi:hypothetical protein